MREWLRSQGEDVPDRGNLPGALKAKYYDAFPDRLPAGVALLPSPDEVDGWDDLGEAEPDEMWPDTEPIPRGAESDAEPSRGPARYIGVPETPEAGEGAPGVSPDAPPAHGRKEWRQQAKPTSTGGVRKNVRITAGVRTDINSKISFAMEIPGRLWMARDPVCGGAFIDQRPDIADALTEIVCGSPDLVAWFTGSGGQFMLWMNLAAACWPVATIVMAHHVYHSLEEAPEDPTQPAYATYAA